ncbi:uncharacterized protein TrAFT101_003626 [Trichoderma asperellum]|uniref:Uncharacterized protein n=1 Tax=Trichoderma asperellum (strain ATCC 204424 / CBS 433.97 / NBRC 101777) TaxID=1042311 RepID=A0A2T3ZQ61_TRIA4|nr:hypothetical protein M441DRAFT_227519 [Trichoderma asperellum CBS 433.97]PTB46938.1 hypothetical protein M441DRAFT_227519 [Trichoderma asperellum CBS 433.97]UKZ87851.1 hypothetical protein TrAFT101_003626 [Trichoderma asperellum]
MAIRERFRRALRRSDDSDTISQTDSNGTTSSTRQSSSSESSAPQLSLKKTSSTLSKTFSFGRRNTKKNEEKIARKEERDRKRNKGRTYKHPSEKPLTEQNLKHQEMLSHFTMTFGASDPSQIIDPDFDGISPCCTRTCSIDLGSSESI